MIYILTNPDADMWDFFCDSTYLASSSTCDSFEDLIPTLIAYLAGNPSSKLLFRCRPSVTSLGLFLDDFYQNSDMYTHISFNSSSDLRAYFDAYPEWLI